MKPRSNRSVRPRPDIDWAALYARLDELAVLYPITAEERAYSKLIRGRRKRARRKAERDAQIAEMLKAMQ